MGKYETGMTRVYVDAPLDAPLTTEDGDGVRDFLSDHWKTLQENGVSVFARPTMHEWLDEHPDNSDEDSEPARYAHEMTRDLLAGGDDYLDGVVMMTEPGEESAGMQDELRYVHAHLPYEHSPVFRADTSFDPDHPDVEFDQVLDRFDDGDDWTRLYFAAPVSADPERFKQEKRSFLYDHYETLRDRKINVHSPHETYTWIDQVEEHAGKDSPPELFVMRMCVDFIGPSYEGIDAVLHLTGPDEETPRMRDITAYAADLDIPVYHHPLFLMDGTPVSQHAPPPLGRR